ncbi:hypothetical protein BH759_10305 [Ralstonia solanacearum]|nr:hypothetical protein BH759_10305 [Ralstonia solanacearum]
MRGAIASSKDAPPPADPRPSGVTKNAFNSACRAPFKPVNDRYGDWQGDERLKTAASVLTAAGEPARDFLGHVGDDD